MSVLGKYTKQPNEVESYSINYVDDLGANDGLFSAVATVEPAGLVLEPALIVGTRVKVFASAGGPVKTKHKITVIATTDDGRVLEDEFFVTIKDY